jgi:thiamine biosynthesis protein ThiI
MDEVLKAVVDTASAHLEDGQSFAVRAHRSGPTKISRREIEVKGGSEILSQLGERHVTVDLTHPDVTVYVDLADDRAYVYSTKLPGPGGLPLSSQWKMLAVLDSGTLSILAAYAMMRRGCMVELFIPISRQVGAFERESQLKLAHGLSALVTRPNYKAHLFEVDEANGPVIPHSPNPGNLRAIALAFARKKRFKGVIFADVGGQLDTIRRDVEGEPVPPVPFYPLIGFDNEDLVQLSIEVGIPLGEVNFARSIEQTSLRLAPGSDPAEHVETILL